MTFLIYGLPENSTQTWRELAAGAIVDVVDWEYEKLFCGVGTFELTVPIKADDVDKLELNRLLVSNDGGFIIKQLQYGSENVVISGYDLNGMLLDRLTVAKTEDGKDKISGSTETIVKHFVDVNCVSSPDAGRNLPGLYIAADEGRGNPNDAASPRLECVADVISDILSAQKMGWEITIGTYAYSPGESPDTAPMRFCFEVLEAVDDTWEGQNKGAVTFSYGHGNANSLKTEKSVAGAKNTLYCELDSGMVQTYSPVVDNAGFGRTEEYANLGCELSELFVYAAHEIAGRFNSVESVTIEHIDPSTYAPLGHIVTVVDGNANTKLEDLITAKKVRRSGDTHEITLTVGEARTKVIDRVSKSVGAVSSAVKNSAGSGGGESYRLVAPSGEIFGFNISGTKAVSVGCKRAENGGALFHVVCEPFSETVKTLNFVSGQRDELKTQIFSPLLSIMGGSITLNVTIETLENIHECRVTFMLDHRGNELIRRTFTTSKWDFYMGMIMEV